jgi:4-hydroxy-tetrahydrodipicolinate synthase
MCDAAFAGDWEAATAIDARLADLNHLLFAESNPIPIKWAMAFRGMISEGIRLPLTTLSAGHHAALQRALEAYFA